MSNHYKSIVVAVDSLKEAEYALHKSIEITKRNENSMLNIVKVIEHVPTKLMMV